jgi:hypothetical protein
MKVFALVLLTLFSVGCGYGTPKSTPPVAGTAPTIAQLAPDNTASGGTDFVLTVNGTNFASTAKINWNSTAQTTTFVSASQLTAMIPAAAIATPGTVQVTVTNPAIPGTGPYGGGTTAATSTASTFTIN